MGEPMAPGMEPGALGFEQSHAAEEQTRPPRTRVVPPDTAYVRTTKPLLDRLGGLVLSVLFLPIVAVVAAGVRVTMGRGVLYVQDRVGAEERSFRMYKFRTMLPDRRNGSASYIGPDRRVAHKTPDDPRHTTFGRFLRKWSLDEVPQVWNVAKGDMSLVGPRPELVSVVENYEGWQHDRHAVRPGLTGLWQVTQRGETPMHEATETDLEYVRTVSFRQDVRILVRTLPAMLGKHRGS